MWCATVEWLEFVCVCAFPWAFSSTCFTLSSPILIGTCGNVTAMARHVWEPEIGATVKEVQGKSLKTRAQIVSCCEYGIIRPTPRPFHGFPWGFPPNFRPSNHTRGVFFTPDVRPLRSATWHSTTCPTCPTMTIGQGLVAGSAWESWALSGLPAAPARTSKIMFGHPTKPTAGAKSVMTLVGLTTMSWLPKWAEFGSFQWKELARSGRWCYGSSIRSWVHHHFGKRFFPHQSVSGSETVWNNH